MLRRLSFILAGIVIGSVTFYVKPTYASGMTVSPTYLRFSVSSQKTTSTGLVSLKNNGSRTVTYRASIVDVDAETGTLLPLGTTSETTAKLFSVSDPEISLQPNQLINVRVTANNIAELSPGGHYAALYLQQVNTLETKMTVPINQVVVVGLFLTKEDGVVRELSFTSPNNKLVWFKLPKTQLINVSNGGNVDVVPRGFIAFVRGTKTYHKTLFNETSQPVFPHKSKVYTVNFSDTGIFWPGKYTKITSLRYDGQPQQEISYITVWYIPLWSLVVAGCIVVAIFMLLKTLKHKKSSIKKAASPRPTTKTVAAQSNRPNDNSPIITDIKWQAIKSGENKTKKNQ